MKTNPNPIPLSEKFRPDLSNEFFAKRSGLNLEDERAIFYDLHASIGSERRNWQAVFRKHLVDAAADHGRIPVPEWIPLQDWEDYLTMRRKRRKGASPYVQRLAVKKLGEFRQSGQNVRAILKQSTEHEWAGLFPARNAAPDYGDAMANLRAQRERLGMKLPDQPTKFISLSEDFVAMRRKYEKDLAPSSPTDKSESVKLGR